MPTPLPQDPRQLAGHHSGPAKAHSRTGEVAQLDALHWDAERQTYADWGLHTENATLARRPPAGEYERVTSVEPARQFVPHFGYVSLFPLLLDRLRTHARSSPRPWRTL